MVPTNMPESVSYYTIVLVQVQHFQVQQSYRGRDP